MQAVNSTNSKKMLDAMSKTYINAKRSSHELEGITRGLVRGGTSVPLRGTPQEVQQVCACVLVHIRMYAFNSNAGWLGLGGVV